MRQSVNQLHSNIYDFADSRGCESETDTEEFEKVGQSPVDRRRKLRPKVETCSLATSTDQVLLTSAGTLTEVRSQKNTTTTFNDTTKPLLISDSAQTTNNQTPVSISTDKVCSKTVATDSNSFDKHLPCSDCPVVPNMPEQGGSRDLSQGSGSVLPSLPSSGVSPSVDNDVLKWAASRKSSSLVIRTASSSSERSTSQDRLGSTGYAGDDEFVNSEFYIDESLPSSATSAAEQFQRQLLAQQLEIKQTIIDTLSKCHPAGSFEAETVILLLQVPTYDNSPKTVFFSVAYFIVFDQFSYQLQ